MSDYQQIYDDAVNQTLHAYDETRRLIDPDTTEGLQQVRQAMIDSYTPNKLLAETKFNGVCLRQLDTVVIEAGDTAVPEGAAALTQRRTRIKARIPEIHSFLPIPTGPEDYMTLAFYPTFVSPASSEGAQVIEAGAKVLVSFGNMANFADPTLMGVFSLTAAPAQEEQPSSKKAHETNEKSKDEKSKAAAKTPPSITGTPNCEPWNTPGPGGKKYNDTKRRHDLTGHPKNPLGLISVIPDSGDLTIRSVTPRRAKYADSKLANFIRNKLNSPLWKAEGNETMWHIRDASTMWADGIMKLANHSSHREGKDVDIGLPRIGKKDARYSTRGELDLDRTLMFLILAAESNMSMVLISRSFQVPLRNHAKTITNFDGESTPEWWTKMPAAQKAFFKEKLVGRPDMLKKITGARVVGKGIMSWDDKGYHKDHFHVRSSRLQAILGKKRPKPPKAWLDHLLTQCGKCYENLVAKNAADKKIYTGRA